MPNLENIKRSTNDFSFTETVASLANNREYKSGYSDLKNGDLTDKAYFWQCLSAVGEDVGSVIYENVLNYIDNVANINTCRLKALTSIAKVLGVTEFAVLKNLKTIPQDVLSLMDIFSINRSYILNFSNFNTDFVQDLLSSTMDEESLENAKQKYLELVGEDGEKADDSRLSDVTIFGSLSNEKYEAYVEECFFNLLSKKLFQTYGNVPSDFIYENLSAQGNFSTTNELAYMRQSSGDESTGWHGVPTYNRYWAQETNVPGLNSAASFNNDYSTLIYRYKKSFGVSPGFNETQIVNDIENGLDFLDNYQGGELSILKLEIDERAKTKFSRFDGYAVDRPDTKYSYYNECEVREYVKFIDDMYVLKMTDGVTAKSIDEISSSYLNWTPYYLSNNFSPYWLDTNFSNLSLETSATLSSNINSQYEIYKTDISAGVDVPFSSFVYDYYTNVFQRKDEKAQILAKVNVVKIVAGILKDICMSVVNIREVLKTQAQRNYMTGTKLLIEYILDEYLVNMLINTYKTDPEKTKKAGAVGVQTIEYIDTTEYYNIDPEPGEAVFLKTRIHEPYFTNMKSGGFSGSETGLGLDPIEIRNFYLSSLNIHSRYISSDDDYFDFMSAVYSVGITKTFVGEGGALSIDKDYLESDLSIEVDIDELSAKHNFTKEDYDFFKKNWCLETDDGFKYLNYDLLNDYYSDLSDALEVISGDISKYNDALSTKIAQQTELMLKYHGTDIAYYPWYNYKNQDFPTFQAHPYLYNFIEHDPQKYPIENAFYGNANEDLIYELQSENISVYLGEAGNILRTWRNSNFDFSGYKSRYENSTHSYGWSNSSGLYSVTHYDGTFYPPAIDLYKKYAFNELSDPSLGLGGFDLLSAHMIECVDDGKYYRDQTNLDIGQISSMWHYYSHLGLTRAERIRITEQLIKLSTDILEMSDAEYRSEHGSSKAPYDVYKYGLDYNNNSIILLKRYIEEDQAPDPLSSPSYNYKRNTPGQLWIKFNSHPIGMPAFLQDELSSYSQVDLNNTAGSIAINSIAKNNALNEAAPSRYGSKKVPCNVYDFDLASNGQYLLYAVENPSENVPEKNYKNAVVVSSKIVQRKKANYISPDQETSRYSLLESGPTFLYPTNDGPQLAFLNLDLSNLAASDYEFDGFFQTNMYAYCGYFRRNPRELTAYSDILSSISINAIKYPYIKNASYNEESNSFAFQNSYDIDALSTRFAITKMDAPIRLGFVSTGANAPYFTLAVGSEIISGDVQRIQNFIGYNSQKISADNEEEEDIGTTDIFGCKKCLLSRIRDGNDTNLHCDYANDANPHVRYDEQNNNWICECDYLQNDSYPINPWGYYCAANQDIHGCQFTNSTSNRLLTEYIPDDGSGSGGDDSASESDSSESDSSGSDGSGGDGSGGGGDDSASGSDGSGGDGGSGSGDSGGDGSEGDGSGGDGSGDSDAGDDASPIDEANSAGDNGTTDYIEATIGDSTCDSFDRFSHLITVYDVPTMTMIRGSEEKPYPAIYALNSDASYIPLYYGIDGQNLHYLLKDELSNLISYNYRWHLNDDNPNSDYTPRESIELLGYSFQDADRLISDKESSIYEDEDTGKQTSLDSASLIEGSLRVYEDYISDDFIYQEYNKGFLWKTDDGNTREIEFDIGLSALTQATASNYNILILNAGSGKDRNPIVAGVFSEETISTCFYDADPTQEEESMLSSGYKLDNMVHIVGTPNPFNTKDTTFGLDYTNHLFNISGMSTSLSWTGDKPKITVTLTRREARDFAVQTDALLLLVYKNTLDQFDKYHYMEPTGLYPNNAAMSAWYMPWKDKNYPWLYEDGYDEEKDKWLSDPYYTDMRQRNIKYKNRLEKNGVRISSVVGISSSNSIVSTMSNIELSSLTSFDDSYFLSTGQITWKISEEDRLHSLKQKYPPLLVDSVLYDKFHGANKEHIDYNVFDLSSTYIFQLEDPLSIANKIGMIAVPIGTAADEFMLVYEDYLSDQVSVDVGGVNIMNYCEFVGADISSVDDVNAAINSAILEDNTLNGAMNAANSLSFYAEESEKNDCKGTIDYFLLSASPEEISDYLKIYVNWRKYEQPAHAGNEHEDGIELFFNLPNLFISPYSYKTNDGTFSVEYKQGTYLRLKSGQDGYLYIVLQFKYYDSTGLIRGVRDLPILTYHIFNVSDDKPKFVIAKTFEIDNRDGRYTYPGDANENIVYVMVKNKTYHSQSVIDTSDGKHTLDDTIDWDNRFAYDLYLNTTFEVVSPIPLEYLNVEIAYERGRMGNTTLEADDPEFVFEPTLSKPGAYTESDGVISAHIGTGIVESKLEFTLFNGSRMDPETLEKSFPIEILNAEGKDVNGNVPKFVLINGMISLDDYDTSTVPGAFLARELNLNKKQPYHEIEMDGFDKDTPLSAYLNDQYGHNAGWILEEQLSALIRMYTLGKGGKHVLLGDFGEQGIPLKTSGTRTSRFSGSSDLYILA